MGWDKSQTVPTLGQLDSLVIMRLSFNLSLRPNLTPHFSKLLCACVRVRVRAHMRVYVFYFMLGRLGRLGQTAI